MAAAVYAPRAARWRDARRTTGCGRSFLRFDGLLWVETGQVVSGWLLDTNVIWELRKPRPSARVRSLIARLPLKQLFVSTVTLAEIRYGIERVGDPIRRAELNDWLLHKVRPLFDQRVLDVSEDVTFKWRLLVEEGRKLGHTFSQPGLIIAATALQHGLTVVTRDIGDFKLARVPLLYPWVGGSS